MIRSFKRQIAKNRMRDMGFDKVNTRMGTNNGNRINKRIYRKMLRTRQGRAKWFASANEMLPLWKRVLVGDLREKGVKAQKQAGRMRYFNVHGCMPEDKVRKAEA